MKIPDYIATDEVVYHRVLSFLHKKKKSTLDVIHTKFDMDNKDRYTKAMLYLFGEEYITDNENKEYTLTTKGINACNSDYFLKKSRKVWTTRISNFLLILCNIAIAIATVVAISVANRQIKSSNEIDRIKERLLLIEQRQSRISGTSNLPQSSTDTAK